MKKTTAQSACLVLCLTLIALSTAALAKKPASPPPELLFEPSDQCLACHNGLVSRSGEDVSIGTRWRSTIMAHAAKDPYWHAGVRRETLEHPKAKEAIEDKCSTCHMPMARFASRQMGQKGEVLSRLRGGLVDTSTRNGVLADDGVSCSVCHQLDPGNFGKPESFGGGFEVDAHTAPGQRKAYGPFDIADGTAQVMSSATGLKPTKSDHLKQSEMCATCHTLYTHALDEHGQEKAELAEQAPYLEWLHSDYKSAMSCQSCHMAEAKDEIAISSVLGKPRQGVFEHLFKGGNFLLLRLLSAN
ncbi:MAG: hypothetical protein MUC50_23745, partial [Myxococcota bacterium]|nr:hypothetical protein [Myxococcota bacterium]